MGNFEELIKQNDSKLSTLLNLQGAPADLQRTPEWHEQRRGMVTGSKTNDLMNCDRSAAKKEWGRPEKTIALGKSAIKYIFEKAMEREHGKVIEIPDVVQMQYGRTAEPVIVKMLKEYFSGEKNFEFVDQGFIKVPGYEEYLGASPDGLGIVKPDNVGIEIKASTNWGTLYDRIIEPVDQSHKDFWQLQTEMLALQVDMLYYVIAHPPASVYDFLASDNITEQIGMIGEIEVIEVKASKLHQDEILKRAVLCRQIGNLYFEGKSFYNALTEVLSNFNLD